MKYDKIELLAPAGDFSALRAAVVGGANAVYLGASAFGARAKASNFEHDELKMAVEYCHFFGVKVYLTVNTLIKPSEDGSAFTLINQAKNAGIDAFIVQDLAFLRRLHSIMPDIVLHISTQTGVHNLYGAQAAEANGARRVILSRETLLSDIEAIRSKTNLEIEYFVHGALCVAFSGNCYFSSMAAGLSGNRGRCLQLCRKKYEFGGTRCYYLSAKDLDMTKRVDDLVSAGVTSLKIEGRMRRAEYVGGVVAHYRDILDGRKPTVDVKRLFNRGGGCTGYLSDPTENVIFPHIQGHMGVKIGSVGSLLGKRAELLLNSPLHKGDGIKFVRGQSEVGSALLSKDGHSTGFVGEVIAGDSVYLTTDSALNAEINSRTKKRKVDISLSGSESTLNATAISEGISVTLSAPILLPSITAPLREQDFFACFNKCGDTDFVLNNFSCAVVGEVFAPKSRLNDFRRQVYSALKDKILADFTDKAEKTQQEYAFGKHYTFDKYLSSAPDLTAVDTLVQTDDLATATFSPQSTAIAYFPRIFSTSIIDKITEFRNKSSLQLYLSLPIMLRGDDLKIVETILANTNIDGVVVNNIGEVPLAKGKNIIFGPYMNIIDPHFPVAKVLSPEYDGADFGENFVYAFGKLPLMTFAHCPLRTASGGACRNCADSNRFSGSMKDEYGNDMPLYRYKLAHCYTQLLNSVPHDVVANCRSRGAKMFVDLLGFEPNDAQQILDNFSKNRALAEKSTRGYFGKTLI